MAAVRDFYALLGVPRDATSADVRWAYERALNRASRDGAHRLMTELSQAFDTLSDPRRRSTYDRHGVPALRERSPGAAPLSPPWRVVQQSATPRVVVPAAPRSPRAWRMPVLAVFCLGVVAGLVLAAQVVRTEAQRSPGPDLRVVCPATASGPGYGYPLTPGQPPTCTNGAAPQLVPPAP